MRKVRFVKTKIGLCACLDNSLFRTEDKKIEKTIEMLELFSSKIFSFKGICFIEENSSALSELKELSNCSFDILSTKKILFNKNKENQVKLVFNNIQLSRIIRIVMKYDLTFETDGYNRENELLLQFVINDQDGSYISFNTEIFESEKYKSLILNLIEEI